MLWLAILTLFPFNFSAEARSQHLIAVVLERDFAWRGRDVLLNAALFMPLGAWLHGEAQRRSMGLKQVVVLTAAASALVSLGVELLQLFLPSRFPSPLDVGANTAGAVAGVYVHNRWAPWATAVIARLRGRTSAAVIATVLVGLAIAALIGSAALQARTRLSNWDDAYPLLIGNELTGDRPWRGRVYRIRMTDRAASAASLRLFAEGNAPAMPGDPIASFDFAGAPPYRDAAGSGPDLVWTGRPGPTHARGVSVSEDGWLRTEGAVPGLISQLGRSNAFTLHVVCATDDENQNGPARILSNSVDPLHRNLAVGQQGRDLVVRVRTEHTGENATTPEFVVPGVFSDTGPRDILMAYDGATLRTAIANSGQVLRFELSPGSQIAAAWGWYFKSAELRRYKLTYVAFLFLPPGLLVGVLGGRNRRWLAWSAAWILAFAVLLESTLVVVTGRPFDWIEMPTTAAIGALVFLSAAVLPSAFAFPARAVIRRGIIQPTEGRR
jgi:glycopeptide antibiotics resistance protein